METSNTIRTYHDPKGRWTIHQGDVSQVLPTLSPSLNDGSLCDPPYGLRFMNQKWDSEVPAVSVWKALLRTCKPGASLLAFGGAKTFHRQNCHIEDAGWELRDTLCWLYGSGFPKGHDISKAIDEKLGLERKIVGSKPNRSRKSDRRYRFNGGKHEGTIPLTAPNSDAAKSWDGYSTALKPAWEPILMAQKPRRGSFAENALRFGCGGMNIKKCRIGSIGGTKRSHQASYPKLDDGSEDRQNWARNGHTVEQIDEGRWPANLVLDEAAAEVLDGQSGYSRSAKYRRRKANSNVGNGKTLGTFRSRLDMVGGFDDEGGASRFFYVSKASANERQDNDHPTVKPLELCEYISRLILPPKRKTPRRLIVPFCGSGSEMIGALMAGWDHVTGIELAPEHVETARRRLTEFCKGDF